MASGALAALRAVRRLAAAGGVRAGAPRPAAPPHLSTRPLSHHLLDRPSLPGSDLGRRSVAGGLLPPCEAGQAAPWAPVGQVRWLAKQGGGGVTETFDLLEPEEGMTRLDTYFPGGFVVNGVNVRGGIVCLSHTWMMWSVGSFEEVTKESLAVLQLLRSPPEILILGCGRQIRPLGSSLLAHLRKQRLRVETMDTPNAVATFNILVQEGRNVACALLPTT